MSVISASKKEKLPRGELDKRKPTAGAVGNKDFKTGQSGSFKWLFPILCWFCLLTVKKQEVFSIPFSVGNQTIIPC